MEGYCTLHACLVITGTCEQRDRINAAMDETAKQLGRTRAASRRYEVHPEVVRAYESRALVNVPDLIYGTHAMANDERSVLRSLANGINPAKGIGSSK